MGSSSSKEQERAGSNTSELPNSPSGGCPVKHAPKSPQPSPSSGGGCPVKHGRNQPKHQQQYNVYSQPIDPTNQMPAVANQLPSPGQKEALSTERVQSTIPKGGGTNDGTTWTYPSPQMFYNALARKGKLGSTGESDIESVVALHNNMNEKTWRTVLEWEKIVCPGEMPKLLKFMGRPSDLSPKAWFKHHFLGHPLPFDRHDWTVLRQDGTEVRYVIDYYHDDNRASEEANSGMPDMHDFGATPSLLVDVRPALDGPREFYDRVIRMPYARRVARSTSFAPLPMVPDASMRTQVKESIEVWNNIQKAKQQRREEERQEAPIISQKEAKALAKSFARILKDCREAQARVNACETDEECAKASMDLTLCMAKIVCPLQHTAMTNALQEPDKNEKEYIARVEAALENVASCVAAAHHRSMDAKKQHASLFEKE